MLDRVLVSAALVAGVSDLVEVWASLPLWALPWVLYLSTVNVGQGWYSFGWETLLRKTGFLATFLGPAHTGVPVLVLWLLFRREFGAGLIKMRGDRCWRKLTCLNYHHETQPMPGPLELVLPSPSTVGAPGGGRGQPCRAAVVPFALFAPQPVASVAAAIVVATQCWLLLSGNFSWLNGLTMISSRSPPWTARCSACRSHPISPNRRPRTVVWCSRSRRSSVC